MIEPFETRRGLISRRVPSHSPPCSAIRGGIDHPFNFPPSVHFLSNGPLRAHKGMYIYRRQQCQTHRNNYIPPKRYPSPCRLRSHPNRVSHLLTCSILIGSPPCSRISPKSPRKHEVQALRKTRTILHFVPSRDGSRTSE